MSACDRCGKQGECKQVDVESERFEWKAFGAIHARVPQPDSLMRIGELCATCRRDLIRTVRAWARNGTRYNRPGIVRQR